MGEGIGWGSVHLKPIEWPRGDRGGARADREMREHLGDHGRMFDGADDLRGAATVGTPFHIDLEHLPFRIWSSSSDIFRAGY